MKQEEGESCLLHAPFLTLCDGREPFPSLSSSNPVKSLHLQDEQCKLSFGNSIAWIARVQWLGP